jgi:tyrosine-protein kinase
MAGLLDRLTKSYDTVLLDSPPLLPVTDAAVLTKLAGGALIVVGADSIHRPQLQEALGALQTAGAHILGIVMNKIDRREVGTYSSYYGGGYAFTGSDQSKVDSHKSKSKADSNKSKTDNKSQPAAGATAKTDTDQPQPDTDSAAKTDNDEWPLLVPDDLSDGDETVEMDLRLRPERLPVHTR